jgi:hypothetical protein
MMSLRVTLYVSFRCIISKNIFGKCILWIQNRIEIRARSENPMIDTRNAASIAIGYAMLLAAVRTPKSQITDLSATSATI